MFWLVDELYRQLNGIAEQLTREHGRPVSIREALLRLVEVMGLEPSDLSWSWRINQTGSKKTVHSKNPVPGTRIANRHE